MRSGLITRCLSFSWLLIGLAACAAPAPPRPAASVAATAAPALPLNVRPGLDKRWIDPAGKIRWPPDDGFAATPVPVVLSVGLLIDRFGSDTGRFFSPRGAAYSARALPYTCEALVYAEYRVAAPLLAWTGKAVAWFDEPGGATQFETDAPASLLVADRTIVPVRHPGSGHCDGK